MNDLFVSVSDGTWVSSNSLGVQKKLGKNKKVTMIKTEMCRKFLNGEYCPYGKGCNFAHGIEELKQVKLMELQAAGMVKDLSTYRTHPCFSWTSTGAW